MSPPLHYSKQFFPSQQNDEKDVLVPRQRMNKTPQGAELEASTLHSFPPIEGDDSSQGEEGHADPTVSSEHAVERRCSQRPGHGAQRQGSGSMESYTGFPPFMGDDVAIEDDGTGGAPTRRRRYSQRRHSIGTGPKKGSRRLAGPTSHQSSKSLHGANVSDLFPDWHPADASRHQNQADISRGTDPTETTLTCPCPTPFFPITPVTHPIPPPSFTLYQSLFMSHFLSAWGDRLWEFGLILFLATIYPDTLLYVGLVGFAENLACILLAIRVGHAIDRWPRLYTMRCALLFQNGSIIVGSICLLRLLYTTDRGLNGFLYAVLVIAASLARIGSQMGDIAIEKDWVVVIAENNPDHLGCTSVHSSIWPHPLTCPPRFKCDHATHRFDV